MTHVSNGGKLLCVFTIRVSYIMLRLLLLVAFMQAYFNFIDLAGAFEVLGSDSTLNCCVFFLRRMKYLIAQLLRVVLRRMKYLILNVGRPS